MGFLSHTFKYPVTIDSKAEIITKESHVLITPNAFYGCDRPALQTRCSYLCRGDFPALTGETADGASPTMIEVQLPPDFSGTEQLLSVRDTGDE